LANYNEKEMPEESSPFEEARKGDYNNLVTESCSLSDRHSFIIVQDIN
jgi:hypothetical protein